MGILALPSGFAGFVGRHWVGQETFYHAAAHSNVKCSAAILCRHMASQSARMSRSGVLVRSLCSSLLEPAL